MAESTRKRSTSAWNVFQQSAKAMHLTQSDMSKAYEMYKKGRPLSPGQSGVESWELADFWKECWAAREAAAPGPRPGAPTRQGVAKHPNTQMTNESKDGSNGNTSSSSGDAVTCVVTGSTIKSGSIAPVTPKPLSIPTSLHHSASGSTPGTSVAHPPRPCMLPRSASNTSTGNRPSGPSMSRRRKPSDAYMPSGISEAYLPSRGSSECSFSMGGLEVPCATFERYSYSSAMYLPARSRAESVISDTASLPARPRYPSAYPPPPSSVSNGLAKHVMSSRSSRGHPMTATAYAAQQLLVNGGSFRGASNGSTNGIATCRLGRLPSPTAVANAVAELAVSVPSAATSRVMSPTASETPSARQSTEKAVRKNSTSSYHSARSRTNPTASLPSTTAAPTLPPAIPTAITTTTIPTAITTTTIASTTTTTLTKTTSTTIPAAIPLPLQLTTPRPSRSTSLKPAAAPQVISGPMIKSTGKFRSLSKRFLGMFTSRWALDYDEQTANASNSELVLVASNSAGKGQGHKSQGQLATKGSSNGSMLDRNSSAGELSPRVTMQQLEGHNYARVSISDCGMATIPGDSSPQPATQLALLAVTAAAAGTLALATTVENPDMQTKMAQYHQSVAPKELTTPAPGRQGVSYATPTAPDVRAEHRVLAEPLPLPPLEMATSPELVSRTGGPRFPIQLPRPLDSAPDALHGPAAGSARATGTRDPTASTAVQPAKRASSVPRSESMLRSSIESFKRMAAKLKSTKKESKASGTATLDAGNESKETSPIKTGLSASLRRSVTEIRQSAGDSIQSVTDKVYRAKKKRAEKKALAKGQSYEVQGQILPLVFAQFYVQQAPVLRAQPRERVPHDHDRFFIQWSAWLNVSEHTTRALRKMVPDVPGVYEWAIRVPGDTKGSPIAFYLGKAGGLGVAAHLRSRFNAYLPRPLRPTYGPWKEDDKHAIWEEFQRRGFTLAFRYRECLDIEPEALETFLLGCMDYAFNDRKNQGRRHLELPGGATLTDFARVW